MRAGRADMTKLSTLNELWTGVREGRNKKPGEGERLSAGRVHRCHKEPLRQGSVRGGERTGMGALDVPRGDGAVDPLDLAFRSVSVRRPPRQASGRWRERKNVYRCLTPGFGTTVASRVGRVSARRS